MNNSMWYDRCMSLLNFIIDRETILIYIIYRYPIWGTKCTQGAMIINLSSIENRKCIYFNLIYFSYLRFFYLLYVDQTLFREKVCSILRIHFQKPASYECIHFVVNVCRKPIFSTSYFNFAQMFTKTQDKRTANSSLL